MAEINYIRHEANKKGRAYSKIAKQMNRDSRTVQKYAEMDDFNLQEKPKQIRVKIGCKIPNISGLKFPRKSRHTLREESNRLQTNSLAERTAEGVCLII